MWYIITITTFFFSFFSFSQTTSNAFQLLINGGVTGCQIHGDTYNGYNKLGGVGGPGIHVDFTEKHAAQFSMLFIQKGSRHNPNPEKGDYSFYYLNLNYIEVPLLYVYKYKKFFFEIGPSFGYLINYTEETQIGNITNFSPFRKAELSINGGIGMQLTDKLSIDFRTNNSVLTIRPYQVPSNVYYSNILSRTFNQGLYSNIILVMLQYKISPFKSHGT